MRLRLWDKQVLLLEGLKLTWCSLLNPPAGSGWVLSHNHGAQARQDGPKAAIPRAAIPPAAPREDRSGHRASFLLYHLVPGGE